jgi:hypothetical protein
MMTKEECEAKAIADYKALLGKTILVSDLTGYFGNDSGDLLLDPPVRFRIVKTPDCDIHRWMDREWLDPVYNVEPIDDDPRLNGWRSFWIYGTSYNMKTGEVDKAKSFTVVPSLFERIRNSILK